MEKAQQKLDFFDSLSSPKGRAKGCCRICPINTISHILYLQKLPLEFSLESRGYIYNVSSTSSGRAHRA